MLSSVGKSVTLGDDQFKGTISQHTDRTYVVRSLRNNLLGGLPIIVGLPSIVGLQLLANAEAITQSNITKEFQDIFKGPGEEYKVQVKVDATPYCLFTPRKIPFALGK